MNSADHRDHLIDMLLREVVGGASPPDVRERVLASIATPRRQPRLRVREAASLIRKRSSTRPSRAPIFAIAAILVLAAVSLGLIHFQRIADARTPTLVSTSGTVSRSPGTLHSGDTIHTGADSTARLRYPDGTQVEIGSQSIIAIPELSLTNRSKTLQIVIGGIHADVAPQGSVYPMIFSSDHARAVVVGTKLSFHSDSSRSRLEVTEGEVRLEPKNSVPPIRVTAGGFAEADSSNRSRSGRIEIAEDLPVEPSAKGSVIGFTLMNAVTDKPITGELLTNRQMISLSALPTRRISLRAEYIGQKPFNVLFSATRSDGRPSGLLKLIPQHFPPFFLNGDFSAEKRPHDCRPWTPLPGIYRITAQPTFQNGNLRTSGEIASLTIVFTP